MGFCGVIFKFSAVIVALVAILIGLLTTGALKRTGIFTWIDKYEGSRGTFFKGMFPATHEAEPWGFTLKEMPDLTGETIFVTGGNVGLGYWTAYHLAAHNAKVIIGCRSKGKCDTAAAEIKSLTGKAVLTASLDLTSFASIRACAASVAAAHPTLDSLVLNAGIMVPPFSKTKDGLESQIGVNHFGHHLLTKLLLPQLEAAAAARGVATVVPVSSAAHFDSYPEGILPSVERMNDESSYQRHTAYGQSKLANVLFAQELAERVKDRNILVNSIHPGGVDTELARHAVDALAVVSRTLAEKLLEFISGAFWHPREAALTQLYAAVGPKLRKNKITGKYFHPIARETTPDHHARNPQLQKMLWKMTEDFIASH